MLKKIMALTCIVITQSTYADTCPTIADLMGNDFKGWQTFNINSGEPLSSSALEDFKENITRSHFALAEWMPDAPEGPAHCYYADGDGAEFYLDGYLVKDTLAPDTTSGNWWKESLDIMKCNVSPSDCRFG